jgi:hypothetical protein
MFRCGYFCCLHPIPSYELKQNTSRFTQFIGRYSNNLLILELCDQLIVNVLKDKYFQFSITYKFYYVLNDTLQFKKNIALLR